MGVGRAKPRSFRPSTRSGWRLNWLNGKRRLLWGGENQAAAGDGAFSLRKFAHVDGHDLVTARLEQFVGAGKRRRGEQRVAEAGHVRRAVFPWRNFHDVVAPELERLDPRRVDEEFAFAERRDGGFEVQAAADGERMHH